MLDQVKVYASKIVLTVRAPAESQNDDGHDPTCDQDHPFDGEGAPSKDGATVTYDHQNRDDKIIDEGANVTRRISIPCRLGYTPPSKKLIQASDNADGTVVPPVPNSQRRNRDRLVIAIHKSREWLNELLSGKVTDLTEIAAAKASPSAISR